MNSIDEHLDRIAIASLAALAGSEAQKLMKRALELECARLGDQTASSVRARVAIKRGWFVRTVERAPPDKVERRFAIMTQTQFAHVSHSRKVGDTWRFCGITEAGEPVAEYVTVGEGEKLSHQVFCPPEKMEDWPNCGCGHSRGDHDM